MAVCTHDGPDDTVGSRLENRETYFKKFQVGRVNEGVSLIHLLAFRILDNNSAEGRVQNIIEPSANVDGRSVKDRSGSRLGTDWERVRP